MRSTPGNFVLVKCDLVMSVTVYLRGGWVVSVPSGVLRSEHGEMVVSVVVEVCDDLVIQVWLNVSLYQ